MRKPTLFLAALLITLLAASGAAAAAPPDKGGKGGGNGGGGGETAATAIVTLGDSYISGEAGRWEGNWATSEGNRGGTDRAAYKRKGVWYYDASRVYGSTAGQCHRSDVAEVLSNSIAVDAKINLACSGAVAANVFRGSNGGTTHKGEAPQADQLATVAADHDVEMIVLSIGGNDLGFADIIIDCTIEYNTSPSWWPNTCHGEQQANVDARMGGAMAGVAKAVDEIRAVMGDAGQAPDSYRLVLQGYPSPIPRGGEFRYSEGGWSRTNTGGCPFWNVDASWARDSLVAQIGDNLAAVAAAKGAEFLDLRNQMQGREVCSTSAALGSGADAEWARFLVTGLTQGVAQESMHPNALGQQATGTCLSMLFGASPGSYSCTNIAGSGPSTMSLTAN